MCTVNMLLFNERFCNNLASNDLFLVYLFSRVYDTIYCNLGQFAILLQKPNT